MEKPLEWFLTQGVLGVLVVLLLLDRRWLLKQWMTERANCDAEKTKLHDAGKQDMKENGKVMADMVREQVATINRLHDLVERRPPP